MLVRKYCRTQCCAQHLAAEYSRDMLSLNTSGIDPTAMDAPPIAAHWPRSVRSGIELALYDENLAGAVGAESSGEGRSGRSSVSSAGVLAAGKRALPLRGEWGGRKKNRKEENQEKSGEQKCMSSEAERSVVGRGRMRRRTGETSEAMGTDGWKLIWDIGIGEVRLARDRLRAIGGVLRGH